MFTFWKRSRKPDIRLFVSVCAGLNQIPLIKEAKKLGFHIIGVDNNLHAPGFLLCDLKIQESIINSTEIYKKLREMLVDGEISGIMTKSYGAAIETTCFLTEKFGLQHFPFEHCGTFVDKKKMKQIFKNKQIKSSEFIILNKKFNIANLKKTIFPAVIKPTIGHAKMDVKLIKDKKELEKKIKYYTKSNSEYLIEKHIKGDEIVVAGIIHDRKFHLVDITDKTTTAHPYFVDLMHVSPSKYYSLFKQIEAVGQQVTENFDIIRSPLIMEFIVTEKKELFLIEAVPEFGGEFIPDILIPNRTGYNLIRESIRSNTGIGFNAPSTKKAKNAVIVKYIIGKEGRLISANPEGPKNMKDVLFFRIFKDIGAKVTSPKNNLDRIGVVVVKGKTKENAISTAAQAVESLKIRIKKNNEAN